MERVGDHQRNNRLTADKLAAAGRDVYDGGPLLDHRYADLDNIFLLPHLGTATRKVRIDMTFKVVHDFEIALNHTDPASTFA